MKNESFGDDSPEMVELLKKYQKLRSGKDFHFLDEEAFERIIDYYDENEQLKLALEAAECGIRQFPYSSLLLIKKADLLIASHLFDAALDILDKVSVLDQSDMNLYILKVDAWLGLGETARADAIFEDALQAFEGPEKIELLFELADVFDDYSQFDEVFICLREILLLDCENEEALFKICFWADYAQKWEESVELHQKLIDERPYNHLAWFNLGNAYQGLNLHEKAIDAYQYSIAINEKFDYAYRNLGDAYICIKNYKEAVDALEKVLELTIPEDAIYEALGHCHEKLKDPVQARVNYRKALHMNPEDSHLYYKVATTYVMEESWKRAIDQLEHAIRISTKANPEYYFTLGSCYSQAGDFEKAIEALLLFIKAKPSNIKGWKEFLTILFRYGFYQEAMQNCDLAFHHTKGKPVFLYLKGAACMKLGKKKEGLALLEEAIIRAPRNLKEFTALDPTLLHRPSVVKVINQHLAQKQKQKKRKKS